MASRRSSDVDIPLTGVLVPSYSRTLKMLFRKQFLLKTRNIASIVEFGISLVIYLVLYPIWSLSRTEKEGVPSPEIKYPSQYKDIMAFMMSGGVPNIIGIPDAPLARTIINGIFNPLFAMLNISTTVKYVNTTAEMRTVIQSSDANGLGIRWSNVDDWNALTNPRFYLYRQTLFSTPDSNVIDFLKAGVAQYYALTNLSAPVDQKQKISFMLQSNISQQVYPNPPYVSEFDLSTALALFVVIPIVLSTMPDIQTVLVEKDSKVAALGFLMGCPESAYWIVSFVTPFVLSLFPYISLSLVLSYWFLFKGSSFTLILTASILFIISHMFFQLWLTTLMKKGTSGRSLTVLFIIITMFFSYLHVFFTLQESNSSEILKHVFSAVPISAYQLFMMSIYKNHRENQITAKWSTLFEDNVYPLYYGIMWLLIDCLIYFLFFVVGNATMPRQFGTPFIKLSEIFSWKAWKEAMARDSFSRIQPTNDEFLSIEGLHKTYTEGEKEVEAIKGVDFHIKNGEVIVMIGPNGAGKSTLMNILAGAIEPSSGSVRVHGGATSNRFKELQKYIGVCFQDNVIINLLSIREHIQLFGAFRGVPELELENAIEFFGDMLQLTEMMDNRAGDLSGGQKRKLCICLSLLGNPPFVILDEPTAGVDVQARQLIWKMISSLKNTTSLITSHALEEAEAVSSRLFIAAGGKLAFCGTSTELRNQHKCGYLLKIDASIESINSVLQIAQSLIPDSKLIPERNNSISLPVDSHIPQFLNELASKKDELQIVSYSFSVEQLEDMLIRLIQTEEAQFQGHQ